MNFEILYIVHFKWYKKYEFYVLKFLSYIVHLLLTSQEIKGNAQHTLMFISFKNSYIFQKFIMQCFKRLYFK